MNIEWDRIGWWFLVAIIIGTLLTLILFTPGCKGLLYPKQIDVLDNDGNAVGDVVWDKEKKQYSWVPREPDTPKKRFEKAVKSVNWLIVLSIIGMAICSAAMINGSRWALGPLIGSGTSLCLSLVVSRYAEILALITLLCMIGGIIFFIYTVVVKKKALREIVTTVEKIKPHLSESGVKEFFKNKNNPDSAPSVQSATTEKIVAKIKEKLPERESK